jgi:hypothetical protein
VSRDPYPMVLTFFSFYVSTVELRIIGATNGG